MRQHGAVSIQDAASRIGLSRATASALLNELRGEGVLVTSEPGRVDGATITGRPPALFSLNPALGVVVGIELEHHHIRVAVADLALHVIGERLRNLPVADDVEAALDASAEMVRDLLVTAHAARSQVIGAAVAVPAPVDRINGTIHSTRIMPGWVNRRPADELAQRLEFPIEIDNDASLGAMAETVSGAARGRSNVVYVKVGYGVGCGIVIQGRPYHGTTGTAGELAHMVVDERGPVCYCGNSGCLHTFVGAQAIADRLRPYYSDRLFSNPRLTHDERLALVIEWAQRGDPACWRVLRDAGHQLGIALANVCNLLNPECLVVGGTLSAAGDLLLEPLRDATFRHTTSLSPNPVDVVRSHWQERAEVQGAIALVLRGPNPAFRSRLHTLTHADRP